MKTYLVKNISGKEIKTIDPGTAARHYCFGRSCNGCLMQLAPGKCYLSTLSDAPGWDIAAEMCDNKNFKVFHDFELTENNPPLDILRLSSEAHRLIGRIEGMAYRLLEPEPQNSFEDDINRLASIIGELVKYAKAETT